MIPKAGQGRAVARLPHDLPRVSEPGPIQLCHLLRCDSGMSLVSGSFSFSICKMGTIQFPSRGWRDDDMKYGNAQHRVQWWPFQHRAGPPRCHFPSLTPPAFWVSKPPKLSFCNPSWWHLHSQREVRGPIYSGPIYFIFPKQNAQVGWGGRRNSQEGEFWCSEDQCPPCGGANSQREK